MFPWLGSPSHAQLSRSAAVAFTTAGFSLATGMVGTLIGLVQMLQSMSDPTAIGPAMAVALLCPLYGLIGALFSFAAGLRLAARSGRSEVVAAGSVVSTTALTVASLTIYGPTLGVCAALMWLMA